MERSEKKGAPKNEGKSEYVDEKKGQFFANRESLNMLMKTQELSCFSEYVIEKKQLTSSRDHQLCGLRLFADREQGFRRDSERKPHSWTRAEQVAISDSDATLQCNTANACYFGKRLARERRAEQRSAKPSAARRYGLGCGSVALWDLLLLFNEVSFALE